jgi:S-adenosylmethionine:tRNA ribosyltransferase-isomerase
MPKTFSLADFNYHLPEELIAQYPTKERSESRLMVLQIKSGEISHHTFKDLPQFLDPNDLLVFNDTKVIPARLFAKKETGGKVEILLERVIDEKNVLAQIKSNKSLKPGTKLILADSCNAVMKSRDQNFFTVELLSPGKIIDVFNQFGQVPLPPYIKRSPSKSDQDRYQTIYAHQKGAVAAPTAGLHFDQELFTRLKKKGINFSYTTLHVGSGTFLPVRVDDISQHKMHAEYCDLSDTTCQQIKKTKHEKGKIIAVGTTSVRVLESASKSGEIAPFCGDTDIFIYPGFQFNCINALITNFHLPCSSLLMLVSAFAGYENIVRAYQEAIKLKYRFFSYGDAMLIIGI